jgi:hypothetical protein
MSTGCSFHIPENEKLFKFHRLQWLKTDSVRSLWLKKPLGIHPDFLQAKVISRLERPPQTIEKAG